MKSVQAVDADADDYDDVIEVTGKESAGRYREVVDPQTGKVLAARVYMRDEMIGR